MQDMSTSFLLFNPRGNSNWNNVSKNLDILLEFAKTRNNMKIIPTVTVSIFNVLYLEEIVRYHSAKEVDGINFGLVRPPPYFNISLLPENLKKHVRERITVFCKQLSLNTDYFALILNDLEKHVIL